MNYMLQEKQYEKIQFNFLHLVNSSKTLHATFDMKFLDFLALKWVSTIAQRQDSFKKTKLIAYETRNKITTSHTLARHY